MATAMKGYVAVTDHGWYEHLRQQSGPKDANFWRPSTRAVRLEIGTPFFFKLKAPHRAVAGFGYFAGHTTLPDWLAWETFKEANGVASLRELRERLGRIQTHARIEADPGGRIGCCLIAEAVFFEPERWVAPPRDWRPRTQSGAGYDLSTGEGARLWAECRGEAHGGAREEATPRYGAETLYRPRLGQAIFRVQVLDAYGRGCAVTQEHSLPVLEAAHIKPYAAGGEHSVRNGLALRTDVHRLFDRGYVTIDEADRFVVGRRLREDFENGRSYYDLHGRRLVMPADPRHRPDRALLDWHRTSTFLG